MKKKCRNCGTEFETLVVQQHICSETCRTKYSHRHNRQRHREEREAEARKRNEAYATWLESAEGKKWTVKIERLSEGTKSLLGDAAARKRWDAWAEASSERDAAFARFYEKAG